MEYADFVHTFADIVHTLNRHYADYHTRVYLVHFSVVISGKIPYSALSLQDLRGAKGTDPCWLLPAASTGREAGRPRVVWLIRSSVISGGGHSRLT